MQLVTLAHVGAVAPPSEVPEVPPSDAPPEVVPLDEGPLEVVPLDDAPLEIVPLDDAPPEVVPRDVPLDAAEEEPAPEELEVPLPDDAPTQGELQFCSAHLIKPLQSELVQLAAAVQMLTADEQLLLTHVLQVVLSGMPVATETTASGLLHPPARPLDPPPAPEAMPPQPVTSSRSRVPTTAISVATRIVEFMKDVPPHFRRIVVRTHEI